MVPQVEEEVLCRGAWFGTDYHPIVRRGFHLEIAIDFIELSPSWRDLAESTLTEIPAFVIR